MSGMMPSEEWGPYRWLWTHLVLATDGRGNAVPYTHGIRANKRFWVPIFVLLFVVLFAYALSRRARVHAWVLVALALLGFLAGHFFWCG